MGRITSLRVCKNGKEICVSVDGSLSFTVSMELSDKVGLCVGQNLSMDQIEELRQANHFYACSEAALHYLSYRPRSEAEVRRRLYRRGFDGDEVGEVITRLKEQKLIDDTDFAQYWRDNRLSFSPRSGRLIKRELKQKGISTEMADELTWQLDDESSAYKAGLKKVRSLAALNYSEFCRRLSGHLRRRGFNYEVIGRVIVRLWQEQQTTSV